LGEKKDRRQTLHSVSAKKGGEKTVLPAKSSDREKSSIEIKEKGKGRDYDSYFQPDSKDPGIRGKIGLIDLEK